MLDTDDLETSGAPRRKKEIEKKKTIRYGDRVFDERW
jgi:hypothetical protein